MIQNKLLTGLLKIIAKQALPPLYAEMVALNCDFAAVDVKTRQCGMGIIATGEIKKAVSFSLSDIKGDEKPKFMGFDLDDDTALQVVSSMLILIKGDKVKIIVNSKIAGKVNFEYKIADLKTVDAVLTENANSVENVENIMDQASKLLNDGSN